MILYLDTSALLKRYFEEDGSADVLSLWTRAVTLATSAVAYVECLAGIHRKAREIGLEFDILAALLSSFQRDWASLIRVEVSPALEDAIDRLAGRHALRGFDLIHLSSALTIRERRSEGFLFVCFDDRLLAAARAEGMDTFPAQ